jgi:hypothetical protein
LDINHRASAFRGSLSDQPCQNSHRIESAEVYRLSEEDLAFGELLPEKPGSIEQEEYEERTRVGFHLERLTRRAGELGATVLASTAGGGAD